MNFDVEFNETSTSFETDFEKIQKIAVGTRYHDHLLNRDITNQHPISAITNLESELDSKLETVPIMSNQDIENILKGFV